MVRAQAAQWGFAPWLEKALEVTVGPKRAWKPQWKSVKGVQDLIRDFLNLPLGEPPVVMDRHDRLRGLTDHRWADVRFQQIQFVEQTDEFVDIPSYARYCDADEILSEFRRDFQNHTVVEQDDPRIGPDIGPDVVDEPGVDTVDLPDERGDSDNHDEGHSGL